MLMVWSTGKAILEIFTLLLANKTRNSYLGNIIISTVCNTLIVFGAYSIYKLILSSHLIVNIQNIRPCYSMVYSVLDYSST